MYVRSPTRRSRPVWLARRSRRAKRPEPNDEIQTRGWFRTIGELRNSLLVGASLLYLLGYAMWAAHAWDKNLGLLPLLDSQYFVAGLFPAATLWLAFYGFKGGMWLIGILEAHLGLDKTGWPLYVSRTVISVFGVAFVVFLVSDSEWFVKFSPSYAESIFVVSGFIFVVSGFVVVSAVEPVLQFFRKGMVVYFVFAFSALGFAYSFLVLKSLPQELGGARPRCASISAPRSVVSKETLNQIFSSNTGTDEIVQSDKVAVLYSGSYLLVTALDPDATDKKNESIVHELPRNIVKGITWYPNCPAIP